MCSSLSRLVEIVNYVEIRKFKNMKCFMTVLCVLVMVCYQVAVVLLCRRYAESSECEQGQDVMLYQSDLAYC